MNKKVIAVFILTLIALAVLTLYSFGPLKNGAATYINPASTQPSGSEKTTIAKKEVVLNAFHNKDVKENYYTVKLPQDWHVQSGQAPGSYSFNFPQGNGTVGLQDVADNTTLELFVLSQDEPQLKKASSSYQRLDYQKFTVNSNDVYQLLYQSTVNGETYQTLRTYITGPDHAAVITLSVKQSGFNDTRPLLDSIISTFQWENK